MQLGVTVAEKEGAGRSEGDAAHEVALQLPVQLGVTVAEKEGAGRSEGAIAQRGRHRARCGASAKPLEVPDPFAEAPVGGADVAPDGVTKAP